MFRSGLVLFALIVASLLPPGGMCWHRDGSSCSESTGDCCETGSGEDTGSPCRDCVDVESATMLLAPAHVGCDQTLAAAVLAPDTSPEPPLARAFTGAARERLHSPDPPSGIHPLRI